MAVLSNGKKSRALGEKLTVSPVTGFSCHPQHLAQLPPSWLPQCSTGWILRTPHRSFGPLSCGLSGPLALLPGRLQKGFLTRAESDAHYWEVGEATWSCPRVGRGCRDWNLPFLVSSYSWPRPRCPGTQGRWISKVERWWQTWGAGGRWVDAGASALHLTHCLRADTQGSQGPWRTQLQITSYDVRAAQTLQCPFRVCLRHLPILQRGLKLRSWGGPFSWNPLRTEKMGSTLRTASDQTHQWVPSDLDAPVNAHGARKEGMTQREKRWARTHRRASRRELRQRPGSSRSRTEAPSEGGFGGFPGSAVFKNPPANAGDTGSSPGPGRSHMLWSN